MSNWTSFLKPICCDYVKHDFLLFGAAIARGDPPGSGHQASPMPPRICWTSPRPLALHRGSGWQPARGPLEQQLWILKIQLANHMIPKKKEGEGPGPEKTWSRIVGKYQNREIGGWVIEDWSEGRELMEHMVRRGNWERGKSLECKQRI